MKDGASYMFAVQGTTTGLCAFTAYSDAGTTPLTVILPSDHTSSTGGNHTMYTFVVMGSFAYGAWVNNLTP